MVEALIQTLAQQYRVLIFGHRALAVCGVKPRRQASELWLEPLSSAEVWCSVLAEALGHSLANQLSHILEQIHADGEAEIMLGQETLWLYRSPQDLHNVSFEQSWLMGKPVSETLRYASPLDLYMTRTSLRFPSNVVEMNALEEKVREQFAQQLKGLSEEYALAMMERFADPQCLRHAQRHPEPSVRRYAYKQLSLFMKEGDPYSTEILETWPAEEQ